MTYKDYLIKEYYVRDSKFRKYESFEEWLDDQDVDDIISWTDLYVKELLSNDSDIKKKILEMRYQDWKNTMPPLNIKEIE